MGNAATYDAPNTEPIERLPVLGKGSYTVTVHKAQYRDFSEKLVLELLVDEASDKAERKVGEKYVWFLNTKVVSKLQGAQVAKRVKGFVYPALGRTDMKGAELIQVTEETPEIFVGKTLRMTVAEQKDKEGEIKLQRDGVTPWMEAQFFSA